MPNYNAVKTGKSEFQQLVKTTTLSIQDLQKIMHIAINRDMIVRFGRVHWRIIKIKNEKAGLLFKSPHRGVFAK
jgi:hypothetical protein